MHMVDWWEGLRTERRAADLGKINKNKLNFAFCFILFGNMLIISPPLRTKDNIDNDKKCNNNALLTEKN